MEREYDRTIEGHNREDHDAKFDPEDAPRSTEAEAGPGHDSPARPDLILDERLTSAAAPFLYLLSIGLIAVAGYFVYLFFRG